MCTTSMPGELLRLKPRLPSDQLNQSPWVGPNIDNCQAPTWKWFLPAAKLWNHCYISTLATLEADGSINFDLILIRNKQ